MLNSKDLRRLGKTDIFVTPVALGCWPIAGMTSLDVNDADSLATIDAAIDSGINFLDTAYFYGAAGGLFWLLKVSCVPANWRIGRNRSLRTRRARSVFPRELELSVDDDSPPAPFEQRLGQFKADIRRPAKPTRPSLNQRRRGAAPRSKMPLWVAPRLKLIKRPPRSSTFFRRVLLRIRKLLQE